MKLPSLRDLVDAELPLSNAELDQIWSDAQRSRRMTLNEKVVSFSVFFGPLIGLLTLQAYFADLTGYRKTTTTIIAILMVGWMFLAAMYVSRRSWHARGFRRELNRRGYPVCIHCGYWLRGLESSTRRCPECGKKRRQAGNAATS
jgi:hypothetical protein